MIGTIGFLTLSVVLLLILTKKTSIHFALVIVPVIGAFVLGVSPSDIGLYINEGVGQIAITGIMLVFAVLFFGILFDAGMFDPIIKFVLRIAGNDPLKIVLGTAVIGMITQLDGSGSSTYLITVSTMLPVYLARGMSPVTLAVVTGLASGSMNYTPWGGPTIRAATALNIDASDLWISMLPIQLLAMAMVIGVACFLGYTERKKLNMSSITFKEKASFQTVEADDSLKRPHLVLPNMILTLGVIIMLVTGYIPLAATFMIGVPLALMLNYRKVSDQNIRIESHAKSAIYTASVIFSAGIFIGVFTGTGMISAMATTLATAIPDGMGGNSSYILAVLSMPLGLVFDPDSFYFGVLPVLASTAEAFGVEPIQMARAALIGHTTMSAFVSPLVGSTWLLVGLTKVDMGDLQRRGIPIAFLLSITLAFAAYIMGLI